MTLRIGSLCTGYGGLDMAVEQVLGGELAWYSEYEPPTEKRPKPSQAAAHLLAYRFPSVPNLGDMTAVDWSAVEPVDVLTGGTPCQDVSHAGSRRGMRAGTRSGIWASMVDAIDALRPGTVFWENVRGVTYAEADSDVEPCPICLGDGTGDALRALGRVLGDLADVGYDARWVGFPASAVDAPHDRFRIFLAAHPRGSGWDAGRAALGRDGAQADVAGRGAAVADADGSRSQGGRSGGPRAEEPESVGAAGSAADPDRYAIREQPVTVTGGSGPAITGQAGHAVPDSDRLGREGGQCDPERGSQRGAAVEGDRSGPTTNAASERRGEGWTQPAGELRGPDVAVSGGVDWGRYRDAVERWERVLGRRAPAPALPNSKGTPKLSPEFDEWLMGLPAGWVSDVPGISWNDKLKLCGNGVVPQQAAAALRHLLDLS